MDVGESVVAFVVLQGLALVLDGKVRVPRLGGDGSIAVGSWLLLLLLLKLLSSLSLELSGARCAWDGGGHASGRWVSAEVGSGWDHDCE